VERDAQRDELHLCERVLASLDSPPPVPSTDEPEEEEVEPIRFGARGGTQPVEAPVEAPPAVPLSLGAAP
jgi:hypothetical protein